MHVHVRILESMGCNVAGHTTAHTITFTFDRAEVRGRCSCVQGWCVSVSVVCVGVGVGVGGGGGVHSEWGRWGRGASQAVLYQLSGPHAAQVAEAAPGTQLRPTSVGVQALLVANPQLRFEFAGRELSPELAAYRRRHRLPQPTDKQMRAAEQVGRRAAAPLPCCWVPANPACPTHPPPHPHTHPHTPTHLFTHMQGGERGASSDRAGSKGGTGGQLRAGARHHPRCARLRPAVCGAGGGAGGVWLSVGVRGGEGESPPPTHPPTTASSPTHHSRAPRPAHAPYPSPPPHALLLQGLWRRRSPCLWAPLWWPGS